MNEVLQNKTLYIFDMDGTIYLGGRVFPFAVDFIRRLRAAGKRVLFFTNNASHSGDFYLEKLTLPTVFGENTTGMLTLVPGEYDTDGFFICRMRRKA